MICRKNLLVKFYNTRKSKVRLVDSRTLQTKGIGNMVIKKNEGISQIIEDTLYIPRIKCNLLSVGQLIGNGFLVIMKRNFHVSCMERNTHNTHS